MTSTAIIMIISLGITLVIAISGVWLTLNNSVTKMQQQIINIIENAAKNEKDLKEFIKDHIENENVKTDRIMNKLEEISKDIVNLKIDNARNDK
jgi:conjugal transfer/entry exclusion protein